MPQAIAAKVTAAFVAWGASAASAGFIGAVAATTVKVLALVALDSIMKGRPKANDTSQRSVDLSRESVIRSATEPKSILYGEVVHGGVLTYQNVAGKDNADMWIAITHAGHEVNDVVSMWYDDNELSSSDVNWGGGVSGGRWRISGTSYMANYKNLGTATQTVVTAFDAAFADITTAHRGRGNAYTITKLSLAEASQKIYEAGVPRVIRAKIQGKLTYDPRTDTSPGANPDNATYHTYNTNPILHRADYLRDSSLGMGIANAKIDWQVVTDEAAFCDEFVPNSVAGYTEARFTSSGALLTNDVHATNLARLAAACNGRLGFRNGKWLVLAGRYGTGANLCTNGQFGTNITGWSNGDGAVGTTAHNATNDTIQIDNTGGAGLARGVYPVTTVVGSTYMFKANVKQPDATAADNYLLGASDNSNGTSPGTTDTDTKEDSCLQLEFVATATTTYIVLQCNTATLSRGAEFDDVEAYLVASAVVTEDWLRGDVAIQTSIPRSDRFNAARGFYQSRDEGYKKIQSLEVVNSAFVARDGETIYQDFSLPFTDTEDEAQRILFKRIKATNEMIVVRLQCNYKALNVAVHDRVMVTISELNWINKVCRVTEWELVGGDGGVDLTIREDSIDAYEDLDEDDYSGRTVVGVITKATPEVPDASGVSLTAQASLPDLYISWTLPEPFVYWEEAQVWRHTSDVFASASLVWHGVANYFNDSSVTIGTTYFYWVRMKHGEEYSTEVASSPASLEAGAIAAATATNVEWEGVLDGGGTLPSDNATVGGQFGTDITDESSGTVDDLDALNTHVLTLGQVGLNYNAYMDISRTDGTPAGFYIGEQTGGPAARTSLIGYEDSSNKVLKINSGAARPLIVCAAVRVDKSAEYNLFLRVKADAATTLDIIPFNYDSLDMGDGIVSFATSPTNADGEVGTATRSNQLVVAATSSLTTSWKGDNTNFFYQWMDTGDDMTSLHDVKWLCFGIQRSSGATDTNIYVDTMMIWKSGSRIFGGAGDPPVSQLG